MYCMRLIWIKKKGIGNKSSMIKKIMIRISKIQRKKKSKIKSRLKKRT